MEEYYFQRRLKALGTDRESVERDQQAWIADVKRRLGIRCIGDEEDRTPEWPMLDYVPEGTTWTTVSEHAVASYDGVNFWVKPDGMPLAEWWASLPKRPSKAPKTHRD